LDVYALWSSGFKQLPASVSDDTTTNNMKTKNLILVTILTVFTLTIFGQDSSKKAVTEKPNISQKSEVLVDLKNIDNIEKLFQRQEPSWFTKYGTVLVAIVALLGTIITSIITNTRSRINTELQLTASNQNTALQLAASKDSTEKQIQTSRENLTNQLNASEKNLLAQISANKLQDVEKRNAELQFKLKNELKETVAKFINSATTLNSKLNYIIYSELEEGRRNEAEEEYNKTQVLRNELKVYYYSIKVTLDGSDKQKELEKVIDKYMKATCFDFNLDQAKADDYEQPVGQLFHKIKSIIHDNYQEPV
jgi:hypothetical protein